MAFPSNRLDRDYYSFVTAGGVQTARRTITLLHQKVHEGDLYNVSDFQTILNAGTLDYFIQTGATVFPHIGFAFESGGDLEIHIYEDTTVTAPGTALSVWNIKRSSTNVAASLFYHTPTVNVLGTDIFSNWIIAGEKQKTFGGGDGSLARGAPEWNFNSNTGYLIRMINQASVDIVITFNATFYEAGG